MCQSLFAQCNRAGKYLGIWNLNSSFLLCGDEKKQKGFTKTCISAIQRHGQFSRQQLTSEIDGELLLKQYCVTPAIVKYQVGNHTIIISKSFAKYAIVQHLDHKAEDTQTPANQKKIEGRLHVIQVEAVISIKRVNNSYLPRT